MEDGSPGPEERVLGACLAELAGGIRAQLRLARLAAGGSGSGTGPAGTAAKVPFDQALGQLAEAVEAFQGDVLAQLNPVLQPEVAREGSCCSSMFSSETCHSDSVKLSPFWVEAASSNAFGRQRTPSTAVAVDLQLSLHGTKEVFGSASTHGDRGLCGHLILRPGSMPQLMWHCLTVLIISYELLSMPLMVFGYDELKAAHTLRFMTASFWALDFFVNFFQGFQVAGRIEMQPRAIAKRYLCTWLLPDATLLVFDWLMIFTEVESGLGSFGRLGKAGRYLRILRLIRLMQFAKFSELLTRITETAVDAKSEAALTIVKLLLLLGCICHFVGCAWYAVGTIGHGESLSGSWVADLASQGASMVHRYVVSFHWAFSQFTPCSSQYYPQTVREEIFNVSLLGVGFVLFTSSLGIITSTITAVQRQAAEQSRERSLLQRYLNERGVSWKLGQQIMTFCRQSNRKRQDVLERDVTLVSLLPEHMQKALHCEVRGPLITSYPLFRYLLSQFPVAMQEIAHSVVVQKVYHADEEVFSPGSSRTGMWFVFSGYFEYHPGAQRVVLPEAYRVGQRISEVGLWTQVPHSGHFIARLFSSLLELDASRLHAAVSKGHLEVLRCMQAYARFVVAEVRSLGEHGYGGYDTWTDEGGVEEMFGDCTSASSPEPKGLEAGEGPAPPDQGDAKLQSKALVRQCGVTHSL